MIMELRTGMYSTACLCVCGWVGGASNNLGNTARLSANTFNSTCAGRNLAAPNAAPSE